MIAGPGRSEQCGWAGEHLVGPDAKMMDWFTRLVPERAMTMIADQMSGLLQR